MIIKNRRASLYILLITQTISLIGSRMSGFAIGIWLYRQTGSATALVLVTFFEIIPMILFSNIAGLAADRFDRRHVMTLANVGQSIASVLLIASFFSGSFQVWHLYSLAALQAVFGAFLGPAFSSTITLLTDDTGRDRANAINQLTGPLAGVLAPGIAAALYAVIGVTGVLLIDFSSFLIAAAAAFVINVPAVIQSVEGRAMRGSLWRELSGGFGFLWSKRILFWLVIYAALVNFVLNACLTLGTPYILARTNSEATLGVVMTVMNLGAIGGGLVMSVWGGTRPRVHTIMGSLIVSAIGLILWGMARDGWAMGAALLVVMFPLPILNAAFMSMLQIKVPPDVQGRVFGAIGQIAMVLSPISLLLFGPLADRVFEPAVKEPGWNAIAPLVGAEHGAGLGLLMLVNGLLLLVVTLLVYALPAVRRMEVTLPDYQAPPTLPVTMPLTRSSSELT